MLGLTCYDQLPKARRKGTHYVVNYARLISPDDHILTVNDYFHIAFYFRIISFISEFSKLNFKMEHYIKDPADAVNYINRTLEMMGITTIGTFPSEDESH